MAKGGCCDGIEALVEMVALWYTGGIPMRKHVRRREGSSYCTIAVGEGEGEGEVSRKARREGRGASQGQGTDVDGGPWVGRGEARHRRMEGSGSQSTRRGGLAPHASREDRSKHGIE